jgi:hypothetical protein
MESELSILGIAEKLVKDVIHLWKWNFGKKQFLFLQVAQITNNHFHISSVNTTTVVPPLLHAL